MVLEGAKLLSRCPVPQLYLPIRAGRDQRLSVWCENDTEYVLRMPFQAENFSTFSHIPQLDRLIPTCGGQLFAVRTEVHGSDRLRMSREGSFLPLIAEALLIRREMRGQPQNACQQHPIWIQSHDNMIENRPSWSALDDLIRFLSIFQA